MPKTDVRNFHSSSILSHISLQEGFFFSSCRKNESQRIARVLSAYFDDLKVRKFPADEFEAFGQIVIAGLKKAHAEINADVLTDFSQIPAVDLLEMQRKEFSFSIPAVRELLYPIVRVWPGRAFRRTQGEYAVERSGAGAAR